MAKKTQIEQEEETAVAVRGETAVASNVPDYLQEFVGSDTGLENINKADTVMPRLAIAQQMSPQVQKTDPLYIKGLEVGDFFNTLTGEIYGPTVRITPLIQSPSRIYFSPRGSDGPQQLCATRELDEQGRLINGPITPDGCDLCPHSKFEQQADGSTRQDCTFFYNYVLVIHRKDGGYDPAIFSAKSKAIKSAKKLNSMMRIRRPRLPGFTMIFDLHAVAEKAPKGTFFNFNPVNAGNVSQEQVAITKDLFIQLSNIDIKVDSRGMDREEEGDASFDTSTM